MSTYTFKLCSQRKIKIAQYFYCIKIIVFQAVNLHNTLSLRK